MLFGHLTESVPLQLAESQFLEHNSQQATAHSLTYCRLLDQVLCKQELELDSSASANETYNMI